MSRKEQQKSSKIGLPPGSLVYVGDERSAPVRITEINFSVDQFEETELESITQSKVYDKAEGLTTWINIDGVHKADIIEQGGRFFKIDQLILEDIMNTNTRPKFEDLDDYLYMSMRMLSINEDKSDIENEQLNLLIGKGWVISAHESENNIFGNYRERVRQGKGFTRSRKEDFIFYRLIDVTVDNYYHVSEYLADAIEKLEDKVLANEEENISEQIFELKKKIAQVKKAMMPLREAISAIIRTESQLISENIHKYFRDVLDHITQEIENVDSQREIVNDFLNLYMTGISNKMNDVMKVLTIFASIFIPLTFIAGIYGMNFDYMPELHSDYGYFITWGVMIAVAGALLIYFRRKKWI
jgi:magnesium transporter